MRIFRILMVLILAAGLSACKPDSPPSVPQQSVGAALPLVMPMTTTTVDVGLGQVQLQELVASLHEQWSKALSAGGWPVELRDVGIGLWDQPESLECLSTVVFDPQKQGGVYCFIADPNMPPSNILVSAPRLSSLQNAQKDAALSRATLAVVVSYYFAQHLQAALSASGQASWTLNSWAQQCVTGMGVRAVLASADKTLLMRAALSGFQFVGDRGLAGAFSYQGVLEGYRHGSLLSCLDPARK